MPAAGTPFVSEGAQRGAQLESSPRITWRLVMSNVQQCDSGSAERQVALRWRAVLYGPRKTRQCDAQWGAAQNSSSEPVGPS